MIQPANPGQQAPASVGIGDIDIAQLRADIMTGQQGQPMNPGQPMVARQFLPQQRMPGQQTVMAPGAPAGPRMPGQVWRHPQVAHFNLFILIILFVLLSRTCKKHSFTRVSYLIL